MAEVLTLQNLTKLYGHTQALCDVSLTIASGQVFGVLGPNGSGKTTALGIVLGAVRATRGSFRWFGEAGSGKTRRRIGALLESPSFYPWLSGKANLEILAAIKRLPASSIDGPMATVALMDARHQPFQSYSLGMKQRLAIAGALLGEPEVLVLDEPTNGVDAQGIADIRAIIDAFARKGGTVILASHILDEVEKVCSDVAFLKGGRILATGPIRTVLATKGWIELGAADPAALEQAVRQLEPGARLESRGAVVEVHDARLAPAELNAKLAALGIVLSHLTTRQPSLESQYLQVVDAEKLG